MRFAEYYQTRHRNNRRLQVTNEGLRDWIKFARGKGTTDLGSYAARGAVAPAARLVGAAATGNPVQAGIGLWKAAQGVGAIAGAAMSGNITSLSDVWSKIKEVCGVFSDVASVAGAGSLILQVYKLKDALAQHLGGKNIDPQHIKSIVDAVFEVDMETAAMVPPTMWSSAISTFVKGLQGGFQDIENKIFAHVLYETIIQGFSGLKQQAQKLQQQVQELSQAVAEPEVKEVLKDFNPQNYQPSQELQQMMQQDKGQEKGQQGQEPNKEREIQNIVASFKSQQEPFSAHALPFLKQKLGQDVEITDEDITKAAEIAREGEYADRLRQTYGPNYFEPAIAKSLLGVLEQIIKDRMQKGQQSGDGKSSGNVTEFAQQLARKFTHAHQAAGYPESTNPEAHVGNMQRLLNLVVASLQRNQPYYIDDLKKSVQAFSREPWFKQLTPSFQQFFDMVGDTPGQQPPSAIPVQQGEDKPTDERSTVNYINRILPAKIQEAIQQVLPTIQGMQKDGYRIDTSVQSLQQFITPQQISQEVQNTIALAERGKSSGQDTLGLLNYDNYPKVDLRWERVAEYVVRGLIQRAKEQYMRQVTNQRKT